MKEYFMFYKFFGTEVCESFCVRAKDERAAKDLLWDFLMGEEIFEEGRAFNMEQNFLTIIIVFIILLL